MTDWTAQNALSSSWSGASGQSTTFNPANAGSTSWISSIGLYVLSGYIDPDYVDGDEDTDTDWVTVTKSSTAWA